MNDFINFYFIRHWRNKREREHDAYHHMKKNNTAGIEKLKEGQMLLKLKKQEDINVKHVVLTLNYFMEKKA